MDLLCAFQKYAWGKQGNSSLVARLAGANSKAKINETDPYAELWMGTHPSGPSLVSFTGEPLLNHLQQHPDSLSDSERQAFGINLPFLFKALSVAKALSIQAHPNKEHAEKLFATRPDLYKDPNHKPEMVTAWSGPFEALCGFRPISEIAFFVQEIHELAGIVGPVTCEELASAAESGQHEALALRNCFTALMNCNDESVASALKHFEERIPSLNPEKQDRLMCDLFTRISSDFPGDVGCWSVYFLNFVTLQEGESMFLGPNVPHAYISGDCLECMACSDNVVRAGLTPKFKDIETLCSMLDYAPGPVDRFRMHWTKEDEFCETSSPPVQDFAMARIRLPAGSTVTYQLPVRSSASILLVLDGEGTGTTSDQELELIFGKVIFLKANQQIALKTRQNGDMVIYQAFSNV